MKQSRTEKPVCFLPLQTADFTIESPAAEKDRTRSVLLCAVISGFALFGSLFLFLDIFALPVRIFLTVSVTAFLGGLDVLLLSVPKGKRRLWVFAPVAAALVAAFLLRDSLLQAAYRFINRLTAMNVATSGAIKGAVSALDLKELKCQIQLCNTYHLHIRPGDELIRSLGGIREFTRWSGPVLTDSGGFQVFSLAPLRKITEEGVHFASHVDGARIFMGPEESMQIQSHLGSTIAMMEGAAEQGIDPATALRLIAGTLEGCAKMLKDSGHTPEELIRMVSSPGGTTLKALDVLYARGFEAALKDAMQACTRRAEELGR